MIQILVPLDGSQLAEQALAHASAVARSFKTQVHFLQVIPDSKQNGDVVVERAGARLQAAQARSYLQEVAARFKQVCDKVTTTVAYGRPADEIVKYSRTNDVDLIALTAYGKGGATEYVHGDTVHKVISGAGTSILLVRPNQQQAKDVQYQKLLVPLDGSYRTDWALFLATSIARAHNAELMLMQIIEPPRPACRQPLSGTERQLVDRLVDIHRRDAEHHLRELEAQLPTDVKRSTRVLVAEQAASEIERMANAEDVGLLVLAAHGLSGADTWLYGPVSETMLSHSTRPLLVLQDNLSPEKLDFEPKLEPITATGG